MTAQPYIIAGGGAFLQVLPATKSAAIAAACRLALEHSQVFTVWRDGPHPFVFSTRYFDANTLRQNATGEQEENLLTIGAVSFRRKGEWRGREEETESGDNRLRLLRLFYRGHDLGEWEAVAFNPLRSVYRNDVNWRTAGEGVTGE